MLASFLPKLTIAVFISFIQGFYVVAEVKDFQTHFAYFLSLWLKRIVTGDVKRQHFGHCKPFFGQDA